MLVRPSALPPEVNRTRIGTDPKEMLGAVTEPKGPEVQANTRVSQPARTASPPRANAEDPPRCSTALYPALAQQRAAGGLRPQARQAVSQGH